MAGFYIKMALIPFLKRSRPPKASQRPLFTEGSTLKHVLVMTAAGSIGLASFFVVDFLSLLYISRLGNTDLTAGVGFASQILFFSISMSIGFTIAVSALTSRAIGAKDWVTVKHLATSGLTHTFIFTFLVGILLLYWRRELLYTMGARGQALDVADHVLLITLPFNGLAGLGTTLTGLLRAVGDPKRSTFVTLLGAVVTAILDPLLIFGCGLGVTGAAIAASTSRVVWAMVGFYGVKYVHNMLEWPRLHHLRHHFVPLFRIAIPAILSNIATPVANFYVTHIMAPFGEDVIAAFSIIDRLTPLAFVALFALSSSLGPIIGQNLGARQLKRVHKTLTEGFGFTAVYVFVIWALLWFTQPFLLSLFQITGRTADLVSFYCLWGPILWIFVGCLFTANTAFNNLDYPLLSTFFNWGRATLGTIPFATFGAQHGGPEGGFLGITLGAAFFGIGAVFVSFRIIQNLMKKASDLHPLQNLKDP